MSFLKSQNTRSNRRNDSGGEERVVFRVKDYVLKDPKGVGYEPDDMIEAYLLRDALGIKAEFDEQSGEPLTVVKIKLNDNQKGDRPTVASFKNGVEPLAKPMLAKNNAVGIADGCKLENGVVVSNWLNRAYVKYDPELNWLMEGCMATVRREGNFKGGDKRAFQNRIVAFTDLAEVVTSGAEAKQKIADTIAMIVEDGAPGEAGFLLRGVDKNEKVAASLEFYRGWVKDESLPEGGRPQTPEEVVEAFFADEDRAAWLPEIDAAGDDAIFEVIPMLRINTGKASLPASRRANAEKKSITIDDNWYRLNDDSRQYRRAIDVDLEDGSQTEQFAACFALSDMLVERKRDAEDDSLGNWYSKDTKPTVRYSKMFTPSELVTENLPQALKDEFAKRAGERARRVKKKDHDQAPEQDGNDQAPEQEPESPRVYGV